MQKILPLSEYFAGSYYQHIELGKEFLKDKKIVFVGLCRSLGDIIYNNISVISELLKDQCLDFQIVILENDSTDNTKSELSRLQKDYSNIHIISKNYNRKQYGQVKDRGRTSALAEYRNELQKYVANNLSDYDFVTVFDCDFKYIDYDGFYNSLGWLSNKEYIHAICGNSFTLHPTQGENAILWNYDSWAFRCSWWHDFDISPPSHNSYNPMQWFGFWILPLGSVPIKVNSAFGGLATYRMKYYLDGTYSGEDCEHVTFHYSIAEKNNFDFCLVLNPSQFMLLS